MPSRLPSSVVPSSLSHCIRSQCTSQSHQWQFRHFSQSCRREQKVARRGMFEWLNGPGAKVRIPLPGSTNYLGAYDRLGNLTRLQKQEGEEKEKKEGEKGAADSEDADLEASAKAEAEVPEDGKLPGEMDEDLQPFPINRYFRSQSVLSEELRERIYEEVVKNKKPVPVVSSTYKITMERVAAVVRLKTMEKDWEKQGTPLAKPYSKAILAMLPTTILSRDIGWQRTHESIADIRVHHATRQQIFHPTSESRRFTREDAAKVFDKDLLPADKRIAHPDLVEMERDEFMGLSFEERVASQQARNEKHDAERARRERKAADKAAKVNTVPGRRWNFRFQDISVNQVGRDGKDPGGVGWRYGAPHEDRKRAQIKIPRRVDA